MLTELLNSTTCSKQKKAKRNISEQAILTAGAEVSLKLFTKQAWHIVEPKTPFVDGWHIDIICDHLEAISAGQIQNLLINIPPRHMKSLTVSVFFPVWEWLTKPHLRYVYASYAEQLSKRDSVKCRRLIQSLWFQSRWSDKFQITTDQNEKMRFENSETGLRVATSVNGMGTGEGGDRVICIPDGYLINTELGEINISSIVEERLPVKVLSYNHQTEQTEFKEIEAYEERETEELIEIDLGEGEVIECTPDHLVYVEGQGYKKAESLENGDVVLYERNLVNA